MDELHESFEFKMDVRATLKLPPSAFSSPALQLSHLDLQGRGGKNNSKVLAFGMQLQATFFLQRFMRMGGI